jgi:hypothetical protein
MLGVTSQRMMTVAFLLIVFGSSAAAQGRQGCTIVTLSDPPRDVVRCPGLTFEAERATQYRLIDRNQDGAPEGAQVSGGAVLIDVNPSRRGRFQILTPHATAAVRGTTYAVDVQQIQTSVFVAQGRVAVQGGQTRDRVVLGPGQGVDVVPGQALEVKTWSPQRASRLLGRFGR